MEVKILKVGKNELSLEIKGEDYTLLNLLQKTLLEDKMVEAAGSKIPHRLLETAIFSLRVKGGRNPFDALYEALDRIKAESLEFREAFEKALKEYQAGG